MAKRKNLQPLIQAKSVVKKQGTTKDTKPKTAKKTALTESSFPMRFKDRFPDKIVRSVRKTTLPEKQIKKEEIVDTKKNKPKKQAAVRKTTKVEEGMVIISKNNIKSDSNEKPGIHMSPMTDGESEKGGKHNYSSSKYKKGVKVEEVSHSGESNKQRSASENLIRNSSKQQFSGRVDTVSISEDLSKMIKNIEAKRQSSRSTEKRRVSNKVADKKFTAKSHNYQLKKDSKYKPSSLLIDLFELPKKMETSHSDLILAIIEIGLHWQYYCLSSNMKSTAFWEEIIQYNELKRLFQFYRPETLRKYWSWINYKNNAEKCADIVKQNQRLINENNIK